MIVRAQLPAALERLRRRSVGDAADGVPAHLTLLYPFIEPDLLDAGVRRALAEVAERHRPFDYHLAGSARWPDTVYVRVEPEAPFIRLQADLARRFPAFPIYGGSTGFAYVPHVTVAEGGSVDEAATLDDPGWTALPTRARASTIELIERAASGRWRTRWRIRLGERPRSRPR